MEKVRIQRVHARGECAEVRCPCRLGTWSPVKAVLQQVLSGRGCFPLQQERFYFYIPSGYVSRHVPRYLEGFQEGVVQSSFSRLNVSLLSLLPSVYLGYVHAVNYLSFSLHRISITFVCFFARKRNAPSLVTVPPPSTPSPQEKKNPQSPLPIPFKSLLSHTLKPKHLEPPWATTGPHSPNWGYLSGQVHSSRYLPAIDYLQVPRSPAPAQRSSSSTTKLTAARNSPATSVIQPSCPFSFPPQFRNRIASSSPNDARIPSWPLVLQPSLSTCSLSTRSNTRTNSTTPYDHRFTTPQSLTWLDRRARGVANLIVWPPLHRNPCASKPPRHILPPPLDASLLKPRGSISIVLSLDLYNHLRFPSRYPNLRPGAST